MNNTVKIVRLQNGAFVGISIIEISAIPGNNLSRDEAGTHNGYRGVTENVIHIAFQNAVNQNAALELLYVAEPVQGQVVAARVDMYLLLRRYGKDEAEISKMLSLQANNCIQSIRTASYSCKLVSFENSSFSNALTQICEQRVITLERRPHIIPIPSSMSTAWYIDAFAQREPVSFSPVYEALTQNPHAAISISMIATQFNAQEQQFIQQMLYWMNMPAPHAQHAVPSSLAEYFHRQSEVMCFPSCLCAITVMGDVSGVQAVASRLQGCLEGVSDGLSLHQEDWSRLPMSYVRDIPFRPWNMLNQMIRRYSEQQKASQAVKRFPFLITMSECAALINLPVDDGSIRGLKINRIAQTKEFFSDKVMRDDNIQLGSLHGYPDAIFGAPLNEFTRHALVVGMPGTGKTTFAVNLLLQFNKRNIPFLAIEPTKAEYRAMIDAIPDLQIFTPGKNDVVPFIMNPFLPPNGISLETFKPSLTSAFKAAFSMPSPLDILFSKALDSCYVKHGWRSYSKATDPDVEVFGLQEFVLTFREIIRDSSYSAESKGNMESAGVFRLLNLVIQNGNIYDTIHSVPLEDILRHPTVIELNAIDNLEQKALIMALLLIQIILYTKHMQKGDGKLKNMMLIDEAHVLLGGSTASAEGAAEASASTIKALQNMIVEIRSYGTGIVIADQSPQKVTKEIVGNTDIKVMFQLVQSEDKSIIANASNMSREDEDELSRLNTGEAYAYYRGLTAPQRIITEDIREKENIRLSVTDKEVHERMHYWDERQELLKPYIACNIASPCAHCDFRIRDDAKYYVDLLFSREKKELVSKQKLFGAIVGMDKRLKPLVKDMSEEKYACLLHCVKVQYIRKASVETSAILSKTEIERVLTLGEA